MSENMQALDIKAEELKEKIDQLEGINSKLNALLEKVKTDMDSLEGEWISDTSAIVFDNFTKAKKEFDKLKSSRQTDFKFLNNTYENYNKMEKSIDDLVDAKIATSDANFWGGSTNNTNTGEETGNGLESGSGDQKNSNGNSKETTGGTVGQSGLVNVYGEMSNNPNLNFTNPDGKDPHGMTTIDSGDDSDFGDGLLYEEVNEPAPDGAYDIESVDDDDDE